jgi:hypothetical protein
MSDDFTTVKKQPFPEPKSINITFKDVLAEKILGKEAGEKMRQYHEAVELKKRIQEIRAQINRIRLQAEEQIEAAEEGIENLQKMCKHQDTTYQPDPSGNNDSTTKCNICGKYL